MSASVGQLTDGEQLVVQNDPGPGAPAGIVFADWHVEPTHDEEPGVQLR